jgi:Putative restriction endonuclease
VKKWVVLGSDLAVDVGPGSLRYPDAIVDSIGGQRALVATAPALIAEVLSPSFATLDLGDKAAEYLRLPSLAAYLVLSQDEIKAWVHLKGADPRPGPQVITGGRLRSASQRSGSTCRLQKSMPGSSSTARRERAITCAMEKGRRVAAPAFNPISDW